MDETRTRAATAWVDSWRQPLLAAEEEVELARRIEAGVLAQGVLSGVPGSAPWRPAGAGDVELRELVRLGEQAWERFHASNIGLVVKVVREVAREADDDLVQQGCAALSDAVRRFDGERGIKFSTFAHRWVRHAVVLAHRRGTTVVTASDGRLRAVAAVAAARAMLQETGAQADVGAVARHLGRPEPWVSAHWSCARRIGPDIGELADLVGGPPEGGAGCGAGGRADWWLDELPADEARVLCARFGLRGHEPLSRAAARREFGVGIHELRRIEEAGLEHVRQLVLHGEISDRPRDVDVTDDGVGGVLPLAG